VELYSNGGIADRSHRTGEATVFSAFAPMRGFCCHTPKDEMWQQKLEIHLSLLKNQGLIATWHNRLVLPGTNWSQDIDSHLNSPPTILLTSAKFQTCAPSTPLSPIWNIPYPRNSSFTGRDDLLTHLHTQLQAGRPTALSQPQATSEPRVIGKAQIAIEYAYRYHQEYEAALWTAESREALFSSYTMIARLLKLPKQEISEQAIIVQAVKGWLLFLSLSPLTEERNF
jgi:hypothetical protein